jgi:hypothetical protein
MMSCASRITIQSVAVDGIRRCMLNVDGFLAPLLKKVELYVAANPLPLNRMRGAYVRHCGNWAWSIRIMSVRKHRRICIWIWE